MSNYHKLITSLVVIFVSFGCTTDNKASTSENQERNIDHAVMEKNIEKSYKEIGYLYLDKRMNFGKEASKKEIAGWDIDIRPDGKGLPEGEGSVIFGEEVYLQKCAICHGDFGEGVDRWPKLAGGNGSLKHQRTKGNNEGPEKTIGSYWPYASTIFDYIKRAMPYPAPQTLTNNEVYGITAYLLTLNDIQIDGKDLDEDFVLGKHNFHKIKLANEANFYPKGEMKTPTRPDTSNTRCMSDCKGGKKFTEIEAIKDVTPLGPLQRRDETKKAKKSSNSGNTDLVAKGLYEAKCSICHANGIGGAPILGDKSAWKSIIKQDKKEIYKNAINGKNGMPPKGGHTSLSDKEIESIVNYMLSLSQ